MVETFLLPLTGVLEVTAFEKPRDFGEHFKARYGPTIAVQANARQNDRDAELGEALDRFCEEWTSAHPMTRPSRWSTSSRSAQGRDASGE